MPQQPAWIGSTVAPASRRSAISLARPAKDSLVVAVAVQQDVRARKPARRPAPALSR